MSEKYNHKLKPYGTILEVGPGLTDNNGKLIALTLKTGDRFMLPKYGGEKVKLGEQESYIYRESDIIAKM